MADSELTSIEDLPRLDPLSLEKNGLFKLRVFLTELLEGVGQGKEEVQLNIPFIQGESETTNLRNLWFLPIQSLPQNQIVQPISFLEVCSLLDEIIEWLNSVYKDSSAIRQISGSKLFYEPLVRNQRDIKESELFKEPFRELFEQKAAVILQTVYQLETEEVSKTATDSEGIQSQPNAAAGIPAEAKEILNQQSAFPSTPGQSDMGNAIVTPVSTPSLQPLLPQDWERLSTYERQVEAYQALSVHAGFLYNQIVNNTFNIYGLSPGSLPPEIEYELRQAILRELYDFSPSDISASGLPGLNRLRLGRQLFEKIILHNPRALALIEQYIETQAQERGIELKTTDPYGVWAKNSSAQQLETARNISTRIIPETPDSISEEQADISYQNTAFVINYGLLNQGFKQNDADFSASLTSLGFEQVQITNIRRLITSYIQTTGIDPTNFVNGTSSAELAERLSVLFSVKTSAENAPQLATVINAYWRFQLEKLQQVANAQIQPDKELARVVTTNQVSAEIIRRVAVATNEFNAESYKEGYDPRLYVLASLITPTQLQDPAYLISLRLALRDIYGNDDAVIIDRALQVIAFIQKTQKEQLSQMVAQTFVKRDFVHFYNEGSEKAQGENEVGSRVDASYISQLDLQQKRLLVEQLLAEQSSQQSLQLISSYLEQEMQLAAAGVGSSNSFIFDPDTGAVVATGPTSGRPSVIRSLSRSVRQANKRINTLRNAQKTISRINTLGKSVTNARNLLKLATSISNPAGAIAGFAAGKLASALVGKETGEKIQQLIAIGSVGAAVSAFVSAVAAALGPFLVPVLAIIGGVGSAAVVGFVNAASSAGGAISATAGRVAQPLAGGLTESGVSAQQLGSSNTPITAGAGSASATQTATGAGTFVSQPSVAAVATGGTVVGVVCLAAVATISTQGAFLDPARVAELTGELSPFVEITKEVSPSSIPNNTPSTITYTITISPKENYVITPIPNQTTDTITYLGGDPLDLTNPIDSIRQQLGTIPINPGETRQITYTFDNVSGVDVQVTNRFTLAFTVEGEAGEQTLSRSAFLRIGNPKVGCFNFMPGGSTFVNITSIEWTEDEMAQIQEAFSVVAGNSMYTSLLCGSGDIDLYRLAGSEYGGWAPRSLGGNAIGIYDLGLAFDTKSTRYTLIHELGHILDYRNGGLNAGFNSARTRSGCYSYPFPADCNPAEAFAEAIALFVVVPGYPRLAEWDLLTVDPPAYDWINQNLFGGEAISR